MTAAGTANAAGAAAVTMANMQFAMSALAITTQYIGQERAASAQHAWKETQAQAEQQVAADSARHEYMGWQMRASQAKEAAAQEVQGALKTTIETTSRARVSAVAGGLIDPESGGVLGETTQKWGSDFGDWAATRWTNLSWAETQIESSMRGVQAQQEGRIQQSIGDPTAMPSPLVAFGEMGASAFDAAAFWGQVS